MKIVFAFIVVICITIKAEYAYTQNGIIDKTILRTDKEGKILGGDWNDWDFDKDKYGEIYNNSFMFTRPYYKADPIPVQGFDDDPFSYEINGNDVTIKWNTAGEIDNKGFYVERKQFDSTNTESHWFELGFLEGHGTTEKIKRYKFIDRNLKFGKYNYRLKQIDFNNNHTYHELSYDVLVTNYPKQFELYPVYPNPVIDTFNIRFYLPFPISKRQEVNLFFLNGKDTIYILDHEPEPHGFYTITLDKKSLGFKNKIKRLYIDCESCDKKKNYGDIQFN